MRLKGGLFWTCKEPPATDQNTLIFIYTRKCKNLLTLYIFTYATIEPKHTFCLSEKTVEPEKCAELTLS